MSIPFFPSTFTTHHPLLIRLLDTVLLITLLLALVSLLGCARILQPAGGGALERCLLGNAVTLGLPAGCVIGAPIDAIVGATLGALRPPAASPAPPPILTSDEQTATLREQHPTQEPPQP